MAARFIGQSAPLRPGYRSLAERPAASFRRPFVPPPRFLGLVMTTSGRRWARWSQWWGLGMLI